MATAKRKTKTPSTKRKTKTPANKTLAKIIEKDMAAYSRESYIAYANEVNEDRSVSCADDGLKPVHRRILWTMNVLGLHHKAKMVKSAKVYGQVMGDYHPHGDKSIYDAMVVMATRVPHSYIDAGGSWGYFTGEGAAAGRYTEARMSLYSERVFFDKFYLPVMATVPNYNDEDNVREPVVLLGLLPNVLINGPPMGIGVGVRSDNPSFTLDSVCSLVKKALKAGKCTPKMCASTLQLISEWNGYGTLANPLEFFKTGKGAAKYLSEYRIDIKNKECWIENRLAKVNILGAIEKVSALSTVASVSDEAGNSFGHKLYGKIIIQLNRTVGAGSVTKTFDQIVEQYFTNKQTFEITTTHRELAEDGRSVTKRLVPTSIPGLVNDWIKFRIRIEKQACKYWMLRAQADIDRRRLLVKAIDNLDVIIKAIQQRFTKEEMCAYLAKNLDISMEEADVIVNLKVYQLRRLEKDEIKAQIVELKKTKNAYLARRKDPGPYITKHVSELAKQLNTTA